MIRAAKRRMNTSRSLVPGSVLHASTPADQSCSPEERLEQARAQILAAMPVIIAAIIEQAQTGSCPHAKFLMEFALAEPFEKPAGSDVDPDEESLASLLLRELREPEAED